MYLCNQDCCSSKHQYLNNTLSDSQIADQRPQLDGFELNNTESSGPPGLDRRHINCSLANGATISKFPEDPTHRQLSDRQPPCQQHLNCNGFGADQQPTDHQPTSDQQFNNDQLQRPYTAGCCASTSQPQQQLGYEPKVEITTSSNIQELGGCSQSNYRSGRGCTQHKKKCGRNKSKTNRDQRSRNTIKMASVTNMHNPGLQMTIKDEAYRPVLDALLTGSRNVVYVSIYRDDYQTGSVLQMVLKNSCAVKHYWFAPVNNYHASRVPSRNPCMEIAYRQSLAEGRMSPDEALAEFVLNNAMSEKELLLVASDGDLGRVDDLFAIAEEDSTVDQMCGHCARPAELRAGVGSRYNGYNYYAYSCFHHAERSNKYRNLWRIYSPLLLHLQCHDQAGGAVTVLKGIIEKFGTGRCTHVFEVAINNSARARPWSLPDMHDLLCPENHQCTNDNLKVKGVRRYQLITGSNAEKVSCLISCVERII